MKKEESKQIEELKNLVERALVAVRDSMTPSHSQVMLDFGKKLDLHIEEHKKDIDAINEKLNPIADAFSKASGFRAVALLLATSLITLWGAVSAYKNLLK